ncbi:MAG: hypothetical protein A3G71_05270 [Gammaproteobacteria bacterium RIFCSPLOWO2_12_FULL_38_14]|nr:MAG: hypothetical protein A3B69_05240 [Gammaproteobacteria bacterium RIFCSPHIGHO2_02_FULL_38_33]OGT77472.1 MAG: hypothetical protein A3G71_05270 [Gammaproteobacteria bacterium RIFCSPLOWO2_12_FULL_38_14]
MKILSEKAEAIIKKIYPNDYQDNKFDEIFEASTRLDDTSFTDNVVLRLHSYGNAFLLIARNTKNLTMEATAIAKELEQVELSITKANDRKLQLSYLLYFRNYLVGLLSVKLEIEITKADKQLSRAENIEHLKKRKVMYTTYEDDDTLVILIEKPIQKKSELLEKNHLEWKEECDYSWEKTEIEKKIRTDATSETTNSDLFTIPSTFRKLPGIANFMEHICFFYNNSQGDTLLGQSNTLRFSTLCPTDISNEEKQKQHILNNLQTLIDFFDNTENTSYKDHSKEPYLITSLMSPTPFRAESTYQKLILKVIDAENKKRKQNGKPEILYVNHSINHVFLRLFTFGGREKKTSIHILKNKDLMNTDSSLNTKLASWLKEYKKIFLFRHEYDKKFNDFYNYISEKLKKLREGTPAELTQRKEEILKLNALQDYVQILHKNSFSIRDKNPNLYRAALEQLLVKKSGVSCKQGEDRTGIYLAHRDSMLELFHTNNGFRLPCFFDAEKKREAFVEKFCNNLRTNHQGHAAGLNAEGCRGLKDMTHAMAKDQIKKMRDDNPAFLKDNEMIAQMDAQAYNEQKAKKPPLLKKQATAAPRYQATSAARSPSKHPALFTPPMYRRSRQNANQESTPTTRPATTPTSTS